MKKFKKKEIIALIIIAVLMIATITVGSFIIVRNVNQANNILDSTNSSIVASDIDTTSEETTISEGDEVTVNSSEDEQESTKIDVTNGAVETKGEGNKATQAPDKSDKKDKNNKDDKKDKNSNKVNNSGKDKETQSTGAIEEIVPETNAEHSSNKVLTVNGTKCYVGDEIKVTLNIKTPKVLENFQGFTQYDDKCLEFVSIKGNVNGMFNNHESCIYYNGSNITQGFDFTENGTLYEVTFKVLKAGTTKIENTIEVLSDQKSNAVSPEDCEITIGIFN